MASLSHIQTLKRRSAGNLIAAFVVVATGIVSVVVLGRWTIIAAPLAPARNLYYAMFLGGPHGDPFAPRVDIVAISGIAMVMWWAFIAAGRAIWNRLRASKNAAHRPA
jgi:hypothetical protein